MHLDPQGSSSTIKYHRVCCLFILAAWGLTLTPFPFVKNARSCHRPFPPNGYESPKLVRPKISEATYVRHDLISPHPGPRDQGLPPATACKHRRSPHPQPRAVVSPSFPTTSTGLATRGIALLGGPCRKSCADYSGQCLLKVRLVQSTASLS